MEVNFSCSEVRWEVFATLWEVLANTGKCLMQNSFYVHHIPIPNSLLELCNFLLIQRLLGKVYLCVCGNGIFFVRVGMESSLCVLGTCQRSGVSPKKLLKDRSLSQ